MGPRSERKDEATAAAGRRDRRGRRRRRPAMTTTTTRAATATTTRIGIAAVGAAGAAIGDTRNDQTRPFLANIIRMILQRRMSHTPRV